MNKKISCLTLLIWISCFVDTSALKLPCGFENVNWIFDNKTQKGYKCEVIKKFEVKERGMEVTGIKRDDPEGYPQPKDYVNPSELIFYSRIVKYFPKRLEFYFGYLRILQIINSELIEIKQEDLKPFTELASLNLNQNRIEVLEKDLFKFNPKLRAISLFANWIKFIDEHVFDHLNDLELINPIENVCVAIMATNKDKIETYIKKNIKNNCQKFGELQKIEKIKKTGTEHGRYFWIWVGCGVVVGVFVICAVARIVYGIFKKV